jgi:uncharacterized protein YegP (UPF0339 family)
MSKLVIREVNTGVKFDLKASNGEVIATSEVYGSRAGCVKGAQSFCRTAATENVEDQTVGDKVLTHPKYEVYKDKAGEYRFRLRARNGKIVAVSEGYATRQGCLEGIECVRRNAPTGVLEEK